MGRRKGAGLLRAKPFTLRMTKDERKQVLREATAAGISENAMILCRYFGYPFSKFGGIDTPRPKRSSPKADTAQAAV